MSVKLSPTYDYIIAGAGAAGLSLLVHMISSRRFSDKKILLVDKEVKNKNDRTWCFWETTAGPFESIVCKHWKDLSFYTHAGEEITSGITPYTYKLIKGIDFYNFCFATIYQQQNVAVAFGNVEDLGTDKDGGFVVLDGNKIYAEYVFNSIQFQLIQPQKNTYLLLQHFKGWFIRTNKDAFDSSVPVLMDFRVPQKHGTTFVYVMPFSENEALIEYTIFSENLLADEDYENALQSYCADILQLNSNEFEITSKERGSIPMTNYKFPSKQGHVINIGTAGGQTRASTGYTFSFIQKHSAQLVKMLIDKKFTSINKGKAHFYDSILLNVLVKDRVPGHSVFSSLFSKNEIPEIFKFLDNETSITEDLQIIKALPHLPFTKAALQHLLNIG